MTVRIHPRAAESDLRTGRSEFLALADEWHEATGGMSSPSRITSHPAYLAIVAMGHQALPWIIADLRDRGGDWYPALRAIAGVDPVSEGDFGYPSRMKQAWFDWAGERGYPV